VPDDPCQKDHSYLTLPELWAKLKPLARQKRRHATPAEDILWQRLRNRQIADAKFRRQHTIERFIVDFYCAEAQLVVEVDGPIHDYTPEEDAIRQEFLESLGLRVIRFTNDDVLHHLGAVTEAITGFLTSTSQDRPESSTSERD
jgi:very-short-patch-repair endonuclease